jgi:hypothetical protein
MKQLKLPYHIVAPPKAVRKARLDNIALVPASLLVTNQGKYQTITDNLPRGGVLICETPQQPQIARILNRVAAFLREKGHVVRVLPYSVVV